MQYQRRLGAWLASAAAVAVLVCPQGGAAQPAPVVSRPVVQGLPSGDTQRLKAALARIARDPRDTLALIDAGDAANAMGDPEAAAGFYRRADAISANNPRVKAGLARALVLQGDPSQAIPLFAAAEAGGSAADVTSDRGLAYDLVGDTATAQRYYRAALARKDDDEVRRRLGISLAIAGDAQGADAMLMPLLRKQDKPGWRSHAFALAIAGKTKEAVDTVNAILPGPLAQSVTPYLRYMPRLTRAQQAAAANLGKFPRASEIGRDDPAIAAYAPVAGTRVATADAGLIPQGKALGAGRSRTQVAAAEPLTRSQRRARDRQAQVARAEAATAARVAPPEPRPTIDGDGELPPIGATRIASASTLTTSTAASASTPAFTPTPRPATPAPTAAAAATVPSSTTPRQASVADTASAGVIPSRGATVRVGSLTLPSQAVAAVPSGGGEAGNARLATRTAAAAPTAVPATTPATVPASVAPAQTASSLAASGPSATASAASVSPGFDLARLGAATPAATSPAPTAALASAATSAAPLGPPPSPVALEQIFADLGTPSRAPAPVSGAVDIRTIEPAKPQPLALPEAQVAEASKGAPATSPTRTKTAGKAAKSADDAKLALSEETTAVGKNGKKPDPKEAAKLAASKKPDPKKVAAEKAAKEKADAKKLAASHPSRIWVQVGVGRDKGAIAFDWRKSAKANPAIFKGRQAYVSDMGRTNRILAGPFETQKAASAMLTQLKKADFGSAFVWTSPAGQVVDPLSAK